MSLSRASEALFRFLVSARDGAPRAAAPLTVDGKTLTRLMADPHPDLVAAFRHCLDAFLVELGPDPGEWGEIQAPSAVFGAALAFHNYLALPADEPSGESPKTDAGEEPEPPPPDPALTFTRALVDLLPLARDRDAALACHAVLRGIGAAGPAPGGPADLLNGLLTRSPLTALAHPDIHTPPALAPLAAEMLPGWKHRTLPGSGVWKDDDWMDLAADLIADPRIGRWLRRRWLTLPETRAACRNVGLTLEMLRRRGGRHRAFILEFYEAYDYRHGRRATGRPEGPWPVLATIGRLLRFQGPPDAAMKINRQGNEFFVKFRPFLDLITAERGIPSDYVHLTVDFYRALRPLMDVATFDANRKTPGDIEFESA